ncbi:hypothetical protein GOBAR_AA24224 [Gossypium barbadense]|uniref:Uncharacterized protein n=1 Tax=Gossypium barbadense TaxID=3634 RepID=A0A2P5WZD4_GOSBA|nr:hypothetical protein GOBAR_AA24224 [Gossypium barbadense]
MEAVGFKATINKDFITEELHNDREEDRERVPMGRGGPVMGLSLPSSEVEKSKLSLSDAFGRQNGRHSRKSSSQPSAEAGS